MGINYAGKTDIGKRRDTNQDYFLIKNITEDLLLLTVCDGMGGANGGSEASSMCAEIFADLVQKSIVPDERESYVPALQNAVKKANSAVYEKSMSNKSLSGMGTTLVSCLCDKEKYCLCWVGDSRIYALKNGKLTQLSHDHSFVQSLVDNGSISEEEARFHPNRNIITKAVGIDGEVECDVLTVCRKNIDGILLCSDGLCSYVEKKLIEKAIAEEDDAQKTVGNLIELANEAGGHDNITVILHKNR